MPERWQDRMIPLALAAGAFALAFAQHPGRAITDTKIDLHTAPGRFLGEIASTWGSSGDLGHVQGGQTSGYLFPMGPFYATGHALGLSPWVVQRLWLGTLLALGAWGVVRLLDALFDRRRGIAHLVAGAVAVLNPFVVIYSNRTTVTLLASAALPWLLLCTHRGLRDPRSWRWPTAFALLVTTSGGGVNGAVTFFMLLAPVLLALYEPLTDDVGWRDARAFAIRALPATLLISLWWLIPAYIQSSYGTDFLHFTEQPGTIWGTTSASESLRLMGFWDSYLGFGFAGRVIPAFSDVHTLLFSVPVVLASLLVPALALGGFVWTRRWRYGPFFLGLALLGLVVMIAGFPEGTPLRHGLTFTYNHVASIRVLRTTYKAAAVVALALACLAGVGAQAAWTRIAQRPLRATFAATAAALIVLAAWPLVTGQAEERQLSWKRIPAAWQAAARQVDRMPANTRAAVLPGDLFAFYTWGGTSDPIVQALSGRPVAERAISPYADLRSSDLLWSTDGLLQQRRLLPGQLAPLLRLMSIGTVLTGSDDDPARSGAITPTAAASELAGQGFARPARGYGPLRRFGPGPGDLAPPATLAEVRLYRVGAVRGLIRLEPAAAPATVLDGSAQGVAELAAFGGLASAQTPLRYAGDMSPAEIRQAADAGGQVVISDSGRRRAFVPSTLEQNVGATLPASEVLTPDAVMFDPFLRGAAAQTVAVVGGATYLRAPLSPQFPQFPEHRPFAAFDGSAATAWLADPHVDRTRWWLEAGFTHPRDVPYVELLPYSDAGATLTGVEIEGRHFGLHPGWNRLALDLRNLTSLRVTLTDVRRPPNGQAAAPGISELRIPGLSVSEQLRPPTLATDALTSQRLRRSRLTYLFERTTGDDPLRRNIVHGPWSTYAIVNRGDAESEIRRSFTVPAARRFSADAWVQVAPSAPDDALDRIAGYRGPLIATSSSRFDGRPASRASMALDGSRATAWIGGFLPGQAAWLQIRSPRRLRATRLRLLPASAAVGRPTVVRVISPNGRTPPLPVSADGSVALPAPISTRTLRIEVLGAAFKAGMLSSGGGARPVGVAEVEGIAGAGAIRAPQRQSISTPCAGTVVRFGGRSVRLRVAATAAAFEAGEPMYARSCDRPLPLPAGTQHLAVKPGVFAVNDLRLDSPAPVPSAVTAAFAGRVVSPGHTGHGRYDGVRVNVRQAAWLVLGESYDRGWHAWCDGRDLGAPTVLDGYANAWRIGPSCRSVHFAFAPNRLALGGYVVSALAALLCLVLIGLEVARRRRSHGGGAMPEPRPGAAAAEPVPIVDQPATSSAARTGATALLSGLVVAFVFGYTAGVLAVPAVAVILWRRIGTRPLTLIAFTLLALVVPVLYLATPSDAEAPNQTEYASTHLGAHWATVAAIVLLAAALWRALPGSGLGRARDPGARPTR